MKTKQIIFVLLILILAIGIFLISKLKAQPAYVNSNDSTQQASTPSSTLSDKTKSFELIIKDKKIISDQSNLTVHQGDEVELKITSDFADEFHLHGYDQSVDLENDVPATLKFTANLSGRFPFELENSKAELGALEVLPQ